jgi:hypothetical protein
MRLKVVAALASLLAAGVVVGRRTDLPAAWRRLAGRRAGVTARRAPQPAREPWTCACGQGFLVAGRDRHRIYWLEGAAESEPLLADRCPSCDRPLPAEHEAGVAVA